MMISCVDFWLSLDSESLNFSQMVSASQFVWLSYSVLVMTVRATRCPSLLEKEGVMQCFEGQENDDFI